MFSGGTIWVLTHGHLPLSLVWASIRPVCGSGRANRVLLGLMRGVASHETGAKSALSI